MNNSQKYQYSATSSVKEEPVDDDMKEIDDSINDYDNDNANITTNDTNNNTSVNVKWEDSPNIKTETESQHILGYSDDDDNDNGSSGDDDSGDEFYRPPEPDYSKANSLPFNKLCQRFEKVWSIRRSKADNKSSNINRGRRRRRIGGTGSRIPPKDEIMAYLFPPTMIDYLDGGSPFPFLRLMVPDLDTLRPHLGMKEQTIGKIWAEAIGIIQNTADYKKIVNFTNPVASGPTACGELSVAIHEVMQKRFPQSHSSVQNSKDKNNKKRKKSKGITIGKMNELLDELAMFKKGLSSTSTSTSTSQLTQSQSQLPSQSQSSQSQQSQGSVSSLNSKGAGSTKSKHRLRVQWVEKLIRLNVTPIEHKWIVRIILQKVELGVGSDSIINYYHPWAQDLYAANKNIRTLCATLCDKEYLKRKKIQLETQKKFLENHNRDAHLPKSNEPAALNSTIAPMLSMRTSFKTFLVDIQKRHKAYRDLLDRDDPLRSNSLALKYPVFSCEIKMDGERILSHISRKGVVKIQTRNSTWYSQLYSPVLGPPLRRAIKPYNVDIILDGEVVSWDNGRSETIPFGQNRGIAKARREYLRSEGLLDDRDLNLHDGEDGAIIMTEATTYGYDRDFQFDDGVVPGKDTWLKYILFDILYLGGPDADKVMEEAFKPFQKEALKPQTGSILNLDLWKRRRILQTLITPQENMVEIVETMIVRPDGQSLDGKTYFESVEPTDHGYSPMVLDSINCTLNGLVPDYKAISTTQLQRKSAKDMDKARMRALDEIYDEIVTSRQLEGLIFKDLSTPYGLGARFRNKGYWFKLKDDYNKSGHANDIDLVVLGGQFSTGMRNQGYLNKFLCGCVDSDKSNGLKFMTVVHVNGQSTTDENLKRLLTNTGFFTNDGTNNGSRDFGKWFRSNKTPDFISERTFQHSKEGTMSGWKCKKTQIPDMWIHPDDSFVLNINAGEIVTSIDFSAGLSLRFARIKQIRAKGFDGSPKSVEEVETSTDLQDLFYQRQFQQQDAERESQSQQHNLEFGDGVAENRFLSMDQALRKKGNRSKRPRAELNVRLPNTQPRGKVETKIFGGFGFMILDGKYTIEGDHLQKKQAKSEGWYREASEVKSQQDVIDFVLKHGGKIVSVNHHDADFVVGGNVHDARVSIFERAIERAEELGRNGETDDSLQKMVQLGVIKWTFLYATYHRVSKSNELDALGVTEKKGALFAPRKHDYLVLSNYIKNHLGNVEDIHGMHLYEDSSMFEFKRALSEVETQNFDDPDVDGSYLGKRYKRMDSNHNKTGTIPWQHQLDTFFTKDEKMAITGPRHKFSFMEGDTLSIESRSDSTNQYTMILYPDIYTIGKYGSQKEDDVLNETQNQKERAVCKKSATSEVASVLPLAKVMGAKTTSHLHEGVTHVLCDIVCDTLNWNPCICTKTFRDPKRGSSLHQRLKEMNSDSPINVVLVSPSWIRAQWL